jgi:hypothetical protein
VKTTKKKAREIPSPNTAAPPVQREVEDIQTELDAPEGNSAYAEAPDRKKNLKKTL